MTEPDFQTTLEQVATGEISPDEAARILQLVPDAGHSDHQQDPAGLDFATLDHKRGERVGFPEVVYGLSKTPKQTAEIAARIFDENQVVLVTKSSEEAFELVNQSVPTAVWDESSRAIGLSETSPVASMGSTLPELSASNARSELRRPPSLPWNPCPAASSTAAAAAAAFFILPAF